MISHTSWIFSWLYKYHGVIKGQMYGWWEWLVVLFLPPLQLNFLLLLCGEWTKLWLKLECCGCCFSAAGAGHGGEKGISWWDPALLCAAGTELISNTSWAWANWSCSSGNQREIRWIGCSCCFSWTHWRWSCLGVRNTDFFPHILERQKRCWAEEFWDGCGTWLLHHP